MTEEWDDARKAEWILRNGEPNTDDVYYWYNKGDRSMSMQKGPNYNPAPWDIGPIIADKAQVQVLRNKYTLVYPIIKEQEEQHD